MAEVLICDEREKAALQFIADFQYIEIMSDDWKGIYVPVLRHNLETITDMPHHTSNEYKRLWSRLIQSSKIALWFCSHPSEDNVMLHKALWEV